MSLISLSPHIENIFFGFLRDNWPKHDQFYFSLKDYTFEEVKAMSYKRGFIIAEEVTGGRVTTVHILAMYSPKELRGKSYETIYEEITKRKGTVGLFDTDELVI